MKNKELQKQRDEFVKYVERQLTGFNLSEDKDAQFLNDTRPLDRFFSGILFPLQGDETIENEPDEEISIVNSERDEQNSKNSVKLLTKKTYYSPPSSAGFSFFITGKNIKLNIKCSSSFYIPIIKPKGKKISAWQKQETGEEYINISPASENKFKVFKSDEKYKAEINALWRPYKEGYLVTLTLINKQKIVEKESSNAQEFNEQRNKKSLFEVKFECYVDSGTLADYPKVEEALLSEEEREIQMRCQDNKIYAVGHGVAANWAEKNNMMCVWADFMPKVEVPQVTADTAGDDNKVLQFKFLSQQYAKDSDVCQKLDEFVQKYEDWQKNQQSIAAKERDQQTANRLISKQKEAIQRMQEGIKRLKDDKNAKKAFAVMNEAMLKQWIQSDKNKNLSKEEASYRWRPFQLGFILMTMESCINQDDEYRDYLDLIWFPTGGGKTEAYLGLMTFLFVYRRLESSLSSGGTVAIMRYTLRLLSTQQFLRALRVILALELIRQQDVDLYGQEPFSAGLWVGKATSPNKVTQAKEAVNKNEFDKLVIKNCPWCETKFKREDYVFNPKNFYFTCSNTKCEYGRVSNNVLPFNVVDETLYLKPPTLLISTIDKFAGFCWEEKAGSFFGLSNSSKPPELIIQDELHLITGPLGSIAGLYEAGLETALITRGVRPKYIASTATIKKVKHQVKSLYAKEVQIFPPPGLRYDDSYFAKNIPIKEKPGRIYVGYIAPNLARNDCLAPLAAILLSAPNSLFYETEEFLDCWWTLLVYHGSSKGIANSNTLFNGSIPNRLENFRLESLKQLIDKTMKVEANQPNQSYCRTNNLATIKDLQDFAKNNSKVKQILNKYHRKLSVKELSSKRGVEANYEVFESLNREHDEEQAIDAVLATVIVATGLDVTRLSLMVINGQPLTTAEFIQASSRVGRGEVPGIVYTNFYKTQASSIAHYENFRSFHEGFYRFVEPSSVTPFSFQARKRALHAAFIIAMRFSGIGLLNNNAANEFNKEAESVKKIIKEFRTRCENAISDESTLDKTLANIDSIAELWKEAVETSNKDSMALVYYTPDKATNNLICDFAHNKQKKGLWETLRSMRNVENSALVRLIPGLKSSSTE